MIVRRSDVVRVAQSWIGTPYHHQASVRGIGTDCLGLIRGVFREIYGFEAEPVPPYSADWGEASGTETLLAAAGRCLDEGPRAVWGCGDVLIFRVRKESVAKHAAIATGKSTMVHAVETAGTREVTISEWWRRRIAGVFSFPGIED